MSLLSKAKAYTVKRESKLDYDREFLELFVAYLKDEITMKQMTHSLGRKNTNPPSTQIIGTIKKAISLGELQLVIKEEKKSR